MTYNQAEEAKAASKADAVVRVADAPATVAGTYEWATEKANAIRQAKAMGASKTGADGGVAVLPVKAAVGHQVRSYDI